MDTSAVDFAALGAGVGAAALVTVSLALADRGASRHRVWLAAAAVAVLLVALGLADLLRERPRETHVATVLVGGTLPVLGAVGMVLASRRVRARFRWPLVFATALLLLLLGLFLGAAILPRFLP